MLNARRIVRLSTGHVTLTGWGPGVADAYLLDLMAIDLLIEYTAEEWRTLSRGDVEGPIWDAFWRLVRASLAEGSELPGGLRWPDRVALMEAMWELNDLEETQGKLKALRQRRRVRTERLTRRAQQMKLEPSTNT